MIGTEDGGEQISSIMYNTTQIVEKGDQSSMFTRSTFDIEDCKRGEFTPEKCSTAYDTKNESSQAD